MAESWCAEWEFTMSGWIRRVGWRGACVGKFASLVEGNDVDRT